MLTKSDLQQIGSVIDEKLDVKLKPIKKDLDQFGSVIDEKLEPIKKDLGDVKKG